MRLIDADALWERLNDEPWYDNADRDEIVLPIVNAAPTVDAEAVVRCKDCVHCGFCGEATNLEVMGFYGFCSRGKRRDGEPE